jgi:hypothetical protein
MPANADREGKPRSAKEHGDHNEHEQPKDG